jgi:hypothetical protein
MWARGWWVMSWLVQPVKLPSSSCRAPLPCTCPLASMSASVLPFPVSQQHSLFPVALCLLPLHSWVWRPWPRC